MRFGRCAVTWGQMPRESRSRLFFLATRINQSLLRSPQNEYRVSPRKARENEGFEIEGTIRTAEIS